MSAKQAILERVRAMADSATWEDIVEQISLTNRDLVGRIDRTELSEKEWSLFVARGLEPELTADPDLSHLVSEGMESHGAR